LPETFGVMALLNALLQGLQLFSDVGVGPSIIQNRRGDEPAFLDTAWTVQVLRGLVLWIVACALALPFAAFYGDPILAWILPVSGLTALIAGFNSTRIFSLYRHVNLARVSTLELGSQAAGIAVMIAFALVDRSIWALVAGGLAGSLTKLVLSHTILSGRGNHFRFDRTALGSMFRFGRWIFFSTVLSFFVGQSDRLVFGKLVPLGVLGVYSIGAMIATLPATALGRMAASVYFPVYSRIHESGGDLGAAFGRVRRPALLLAGWMIAGLAAGGDAAVRLLYDARYAEAGWILQVLALGSWFSVLESTNGAALLARGNARWVAAGNGGKLAGMLVLIPAGFLLGGFTGAVIGLAASDVLKYAVSAFATTRGGLRGWPEDLRLTTWVLATAACGAYCARLADDAGAGTFGSVLAVFVAVSLAWAPLGAAHWRASRSSHRLTT
jgi:O-antigen/teichoic acid export membrane protein